MVQARMGTPPARVRAPKTQEKSARVGCTCLLLRRTWKVKECELRVGFLVGIITVTRRSEWATAQAPSGEPSRAL